MKNIFAKPISFLAAFTACGIMSLATGCASGGFKMTRQYAGFVNKQSLIIRIVLYILTSVVFAVTMLIDMVVFNTMDFWEGRVSAGTYNFTSGEKVYQARHEFIPGTKLRRSFINVKDKNNKTLQDVVLTETNAGEIEVTVDGKLKGRVHGISEVPVASIFDKNGVWVEDRLILSDSVAMN